MARSAPGPLFWRDGSGLKILRSAETLENILHMCVQVSTSTCAHTSSCWMTFSQGDMEDGDTHPSGRCARLGSYKRTVMR